VLENKAKKRGQLTQNAQQKRPKSWSLESNCSKTMPKKLKTLTDPNPDFRKPTTTDEKAYPTMEAVPKFRQSARWECCWPEVDRSRHRRPGNPVPIVAPDLAGEG
jgi:hypothetical protein